MKGFDATFVVGCKRDGVDEAIDHRMFRRNGSGDGLDLVFEFDIADVDLTVAHQFLNRL